MADSARLLHTSLLLKEAAVALVLGGPLVGIILHVRVSRNPIKTDDLGAPPTLRTPPGPRLVGMGIVELRVQKWQYSQRLKSIGVGEWGWVGGRRKIKRKRDMIIYDI